MPAFTRHAMLLRYEHVTIVTLSLHRHVHIYPHIRLHGAMLRLLMLIALPLFSHIRRACARAIDLSMRR